MNSPDMDNAQWAILAGLRFFLAFCVMATHVWIVAPDSFIVSHFGAWGHAAVFCFFMISGYSIAASISSRKEGYLLRRIKRIYPSYIFALALCYILTIFGPMHSPSGQTVNAPSIPLVIENLFMLQGVWVWAIDADPPLWTLSIEWWCYILAIVLIVCDNRKITLVTATLFIATVVGLRVFGLGPESPLFGPPTIMFWASTWMGGFAYYRKRSVANFFLMLAPSLVMFYFYDRWILQSAAAILVLCAVMISISRYFSIKRRVVKSILNWIGDVSYPLYLLHFPLMFAIVTYTPIRHGDSVIAIILSTVFIGYYLACVSIKWLAEKIRVPEQIQPEG